MSEGGEGSKPGSGKKLNWFLRAATAVGLAAGMRGGESRATVPVFSQGVEVQAGVGDWASAKEVCGEGYKTIALGNRPARGSMEVVSAKDNGAPIAFDVRSTSSGFESQSSTSQDGPFNYASGEPSAEFPSGASTYLGINMCQGTNGEYLQIAIDQADPNFKADEFDVTVTTIKGPMAIKISPADFATWQQETGDSVWMPLNGSNVPAGAKNILPGASNLGEIQQIDASIMGGGKQINFSAIPSK